MGINSEIYLIGLAVLFFLIIVFLFIRKVSNAGNLKVKIESIPDPFDAIEEDNNLQEEASIDLFESKNHQYISANDNDGIKVCKADIQIKGEISFEGDYPEDDTVVTLKNFTTNKSETMTFEEFCETGCMHSSAWPDLYEIEQRLSLLTNDWSIHWNNEELTEE